MEKVDIGRGIAPGGLTTIRRGLEDNSALRNLALALLAVGVGALGGLAIVMGNPVVPFAALVALVALPWLITRPLFDLALVACTVILLPYAVLPVHLAFVTPTLLEVVLLSLYAAWFLRLLFDPSHRFARTPIDGWLFVFVGFSLFAFLLGIWRDPAADVIHNYFKLLLGAGVFFAASNVLAGPRQIETALRVIVLGGALESLIGLVLWRLPDPTAQSLLLRLAPIGYPTDRVLRYIEDNPALGERAVGTQVDPNSYAGLLVIVAVLTGACLLARKPILPRWVLLPALLLDLGALFLTQSRTAFLGIVAAGVLLGLLRYRKILGWGMVGAIVVLASGVASSYVSRLVAGLTFQDVSNQQRLAEYANAVQVIQSYPVFGVGFGASGELSLTTGASSVYLTVAERTGLLGLAAYLAVLAVFFTVALTALSRLKRIAPPDESDEGARSEWTLLDTAIIGGTTAIFGAVVVGLTDHYYFNIEFPHMAALFWLTAALTLSARRLLVDRAVEQPPTAGTGAQIVISPKKAA